jgi:hypothetical protein
MQQVHLMPDGGLGSGKLHQGFQDTTAERFGDMKNLHGSLEIAVIVRDSRRPTGRIPFKNVVSPSVGFQRFDVSVDRNDVSTAVEHRSGRAHSHQAFVDEEPLSAC